MIFNVPPQSGGTDGPLDGYGAPLAPLQGIEADPAHKLFVRALDYLHNRGDTAASYCANLACQSALTPAASAPLPAVPPTTAAELFVSMASSREVQRAKAALESEHYDPTVPSPALDPTAVSVLVIRGLHAMRPPLLSPEESGALVAEFMHDSSAHVRLSVAMHTLDRLPPARRGALQRLLRYLRRQAAFSAACSPAGLAQTIGPVLLRPERLDAGRPAHELTAGAIRATKMLIE
jgi:hypothetical protein